MSYKFSQIVGKLVGSSSSLGHGLKAAKDSGSKIIFSSSQVKIAKVNNADFMKGGKGGSDLYGPINKGFVQRQKQFQVDDGVPIHLKGGQRDRILYYTTLLLCAVGLEECIRYYYEASFPKKAS